MKKPATKRPAKRPVRPKKVRDRMKTPRTTAKATSSGVRKRTESAYLASIVENSQDAIIGVSLDGIIQSWNSAAERLHGYPSEEIIGKHVSILVPEDRRHEPAMLYERLGRGERVSAFETVRIRKDGSPIDVELSLAAIMDGHRPSMAVVVVRDISKRKRTEEALRMREERYALVEAATNDGVWDWNPVTHELYISPRWKALLGFADDELEAKENTFFSSIHPDDVAIVREALRSHFEEREPYDIDLRLRCKGGGFRWFNSRGQAIRDGKDRVVRMVGAITDITTAKQTEDLLFNAHQRLQAVLNAVPVGVSFSDDATCERITGNPTAMAQFGISPGANFSASTPDASAAGRQLRFFRDDRQLKGSELPLQRAVAENKIIPAVDLEVHLPDGRRLSIEARGAPIRDRDGEVVAGVAVTLDVTDRKRAETALRQSANELRKLARDLSSERSRLAEAQALAKMGSWELDLKTSVLTWSEEAYRIFGMEPKSAKVTREIFRESVHPDDRQSVREAYDRSVAEHSPFEIDHRLLLKDGTLKFVREYCQTLYDKRGKPLRSVGTVHDITESRRAEVALQQSYDVLAKVFRQVPGAIFQFQLFPDGRSCVPFASEQLRELFEIAPEEVRNDATALLNVVHPDDHDGFFASIQESARTLEPWHYEYRVLLPRQGLRWRMGDSRPERLADGSTLWNGFITDTTDRKRVEEALKDSEQQLSAIYAHVPGVVFSLAVERDGGFRFVSVNQAFVQTTGLAEERVVGKLVEEVIPEPSLGLVLGKYREAIETGRTVRWDEVSVYPTGEKHGAVSVTPIVNDKGEVTHLIGAVHDITERKHAEDALAESERRLNEAQSLGGIGDWQFDVRTGKIQWSAALFGLFERDPAKGAPNFEENMAYYFPEDSLRLHECVRCAIETGEGYELDLHLRLPSGRDAWHHAVAKVSRDRLGRVAKLFGTAQDITERKKAEETLRQLNTLLEKRVALRTASLLTSTDSLLRSSNELRKEKDERRRLEEEIIEISEAERRRIGHDLHDDLGQQLAGLSWLSSVLEKNLAAQSSPETGSAARIAALLGGALNLTRSLARGLQPVPVEPGGLMAALTGLATRTSEMFKVECVFECKRPVHIRNPTAATHLYRIAQEAVTNAVRHGHAKQVQIALSSAKGILQISVIGDGDPWKEPDAGHEGLGVRIMRFRAETMGGTLSFQKKRRTGVRVTCKIPRPADLPAEPESSAPTRRG